MKAHRSLKLLKLHRKQYGFFDFGLGLALLTLFGVTANVVTPNPTRELAQDNPQQTVSCKNILTKSSIDASDCSKQKEKYQ